MTIIDEEAELFDEFGNYIGPQQHQLIHVPKEEEDVLKDEWTDVSEQEETGEENKDLALDHIGERMSNAHLSGSQMTVALPDERAAYPSSLQVYGSRVETLVEEVDTQPLSRPIIAPVKQKRIQLKEPSLPKLTYTPEDLCAIDPKYIRNVALIGALHHGKTGLIDTLVEATHTLETSRMNPKDLQRQQDEQLPLNYTDSYFSERLRKISLMGKCLTVKSGEYLLNMLDTPGHSDFTDEAICQLRLCDGVILVVDVVEGPLLQTERLLKLAFANDLPIILVLNKLDRIILELCLPPMDAYLRLQHVIAECNAIIGITGYFSPPKGNVLFASCKYGWLFSLASWTRYKLGKQNEQSDFLKCLWSRHCTFDGDHLIKANSISQKRAFVALVLEPLYKIHSQVIGENKDALKRMNASLGIRLKGKELDQNVKPLLSTVMGKFLRWSAFIVLTETLTSILPSPLDAASRISEHYVATDQGISTDPISKAIFDGSPEGPLVAFVSKLYPQGINPQKSEFAALVRVYSGTLKRGMPVRVLGHAFRTDDPQENSAMARIKNVCFSGGGRYDLEVPQAVGPGSIVLVYGVDKIITSQGATLLDTHLPLKTAVVLRPLRFYQLPIIKIALEALLVDHLPLMLETLGKLVKIYPSLKLRAEDSGEHSLMGPGELYLDCVLHDLRNVLANNQEDETKGLEVRLNEPSVSFCETVADISYSKATAMTPNGKSHLVMIAEPIKDSKLIEAIENGLFMYNVADRVPFGRCEFNPNAPLENAFDGIRYARISSALQQDFGYDALAARGFWGFGPHHLIGPNILIDDILPGDVDPSFINESRESILQGFRWATRAGPLCDEPMRGVQFRLIGASLAKDKKDRPSGQLIPTTRRVCFGAMLLANPRIMEPISLVEIVTPSVGIEIISQLLAQRRGHILSRKPISATPLHQLQALIPVIDSFGFEVDVRIHTLGQAWCQSTFSHWQIVPGDPLDENIQLSLLEPSPAPHLARDFILKTRRRKGLGEDLSPQRYFQ